MWGIDRLSNGELSELRKRLRGGGVAALTHAEYRYIDTS